MSLDTFVEEIKVTGQKKPARCSNAQRKVYCQNVTDPKMSGKKE